MKRTALVKNQVFCILVQFKFTSKQLSHSLTLQYFQCYLHRLILYTQNSTYDYISKFNFIYSMEPTTYETLSFKHLVMCSGIQLQNYTHIIKHSVSNLHYYFKRKKFQFVVKFILLHNFIKPSSLLPQMTSSIYFSYLVLIFLNIPGLSPSTSSQPVSKLR